MAQDLWGSAAAAACRQGLLEAVAGAEAVEVAQTWQQDSPRKSTRPTSSRENWGSIAAFMRQAPHLST